MRLDSVIQVSSRRFGWNHSRPLFPGVRIWALVCVRDVPVVLLSELALVQLRRPPCFKWHGEISIYSTGVLVYRGMGKSFVFAHLWFRE